MKKKLPTHDKSVKDKSIFLQDIETYHRFAFYFLILALIPITFGVYLIYSVIEVDSSIFSTIVQKFAVNPGYFAPEPQERYAYLFVLICVPLLILVSLFSFKNKQLYEKFQDILQRISYPSKVQYQNRLIFFICSALLFFTFYFENNFYLKHTILFSWEVVIAILGSYFLQQKNTVLNKLNSAKTVWFIVVLISLFRMSNLIFEATDFQALYHDGHFEVPFYSVVRAFWGGTLYSDCPNQYGFYGMFLMPIFKIIGINVFNYTVVMSGLCVISFLLFFYFLKYLYANQWVAFLVWFAYVSIAYIFILEGYNYFIANNMPFRMDPYFQFIPIRFFYPTLMLFFAVIQDKYKQNWMIYVGSFLLSFGLFWNLEMGVIVVLSWLLFQMYQNYGFYPIVRTCLKVLGSYFAGVGVFIILFYAQYQAIFSMANLMSFQDIFYISGFFMLPMPIFGSWVIIALMYVWGLIYSGYTWFFKINDSKRNFIFLISIFGAGYFSYYQGRSHLWVLPAVTMPAFIIAGYLLDYYLKKKVRGFAFILSFLTLILLFSAMKNLWIVKDEVLARILDRDQIAANEFKSLGQMVRPNEKALFLSYSLGTLHTETLTEPVLCTSFSELLLKKDLNHILNILSNKQTYPIIMDSTWLTLLKSKPEWAQLQSLILNKYEVEMVSPNKSFFRIRMKN